MPATTAATTPRQKNAETDTTLRKTDYKNMKKTYITFSAMALALLSTGVMASCGEAETAKAPAKASTAKNAAQALPNYRYVDLDSVLSKYNLAKDYSEEMLRMQSNLESAAKSHQTKIQNFANTVQNKVQNNGYLSEASYKQDERTMANMQNEAQRSMASMQSNFEQAALKGQQAVNDSIKAFIEQYNKTRGYDAILIKNATLYINPALDITDEVVEGLNARYNKVKK